MPRLRTVDKSETEKINHFSLVDVGVDTVKVAVVALKNSQIQVLGHSLAATQGRDVMGGRAEAAALAATVNGALQQAEDASEAIAGYKVVPDKALFILPERALLGNRFTVKQRRSTPRQPVGQQEIDMLWERAIRLARQGLPALPGAGPDWIPHTVTPAGLWLDGHLVNDLLGLQGAELTLSVYGVICQPAIIRALEQLAERLELEIHRLVAASQSLTTIIPARDALVLDIGWSGTDCYLIRHDSLVAAGRTFMGGDFFTRSLANLFKRPVEVAETLKLAFSSRDVLSKEDTRLVQQGLREPLARWGDLVAETICNFNLGEQLPGQLYFVGGSALLPGLKTHLLASLKEVELTFARAPEFANLGETPLNGFSHAPTGFRGILFALVLSLAKTL